MDCRPTPAPYNAIGPPLSAPHHRPATTIGLPPPSACHHCPATVSPPPPLVPPPSSDLHHPVWSTTAVDPSPPLIHHHRWCWTTIGLPPSFHHLVVFSFSLSVAFLTYSLHRLLVSSHPKICKCTFFHIFICLGKRYVQKESFRLSEKNKKRKNFDKQRKVDLQR